MNIYKDFLVIGSGVAGLTFALKVSEFGSVGIITKDVLEESATKYAQGGCMASSRLCVIGQESSVEKMARMTVDQ